MMHSQELRPLPLRVNGIRSDEGLSRLKPRATTCAVIALLLLLCVGFLRVASASPADPDPSFGIGGVAALPALPPIPQLALPPRTIYAPSPRAVAVQQDGKILVGVTVDACGNSPLSFGCSPGYAAVVRYNTDGSVDNGFGTNGVATGPIALYSPLLALLRQDDGKIVLAGGLNASWALRLNTNGTPDTTFGNQGMVMIPTFTQNGAMFSYFPHALAQQRDGKLLIAATLEQLISGVLQGSSVLRLNLDGSIDSTYGNGGFAPLALQILYSGLGFPPTIMAVQSDGKLLIAAARTGTPPSVSVSSFVERLNSDGTPDATFGDNKGVTSIAFTDTPLQFIPNSAPLSISILANSKLLITGVQNAPTDNVGQFGIVQLSADGKPDPAFGTGGRVIFAAAGSLDNASTVRQSDGKLIFAGRTPSSLDITGARSTFITRLNPDGSADPEFGSCGTRQMSQNPYGFSPPLALQSDGKILFADPSVLGLAVLRLQGGESTGVYFGSNPNPAPVGTPTLLGASVFGASGSLPGPGAPTGTVTFNDGTTAIAGCTAVPVVAIGAQVGMGFSFGATCQAQTFPGVHTLSATYNGDAVNPVASSCATAQFVDQPGTATAVEFYHGVFDHYFITSLPDEVSKLDAGYFRGWGRTGQHFFVHPIDQLAGSSPVCRFFSGQSFAPKSSHFFTPIASECAAVMQNPGWLFEGTVFGLTLPDAEGSCSPGTEALYRLYNDGQGGAPNHRYLTDKALRDRMAKFFGWIPEGFGIGVIGCVQ